MMPGMMPGMQPQGPMPGGPMPMGPQGPGMQPGMMAPGMQPQGPPPGPAMQAMMPGPGGQPMMGPPGMPPQGQGGDIAMQVLSMISDLVGGLLQQIGPYDPRAVTLSDIQRDVIGLMSGQPGVMSRKTNQSGKSEDKMDKDFATRRSNTFTNGNDIMDVPPPGIPQ